jgi:ubiquinone/menaquinone biosynthesis C-methylase UbiE
MKHSHPNTDQSIDMIVSTLVLCSVDDPEAAVRKCRRVLKRRGSVLLIEQLQSDHPRRAWIQDLITPVWRRIAANCHPNRETLGTVGRAGFNFQASEWLALGAPWIQPIVAGMATRR